MDYMPKRFVLLSTSAVIGIVGYGALRHQPAMQALFAPPQQAQQPSSNTELNAQVQSMQQAIVKLQGNLQDAVAKDKVATIQLTGLQTEAVKLQNAAVQQRALAAAAAQQVVVRSATPPQVQSVSKGSGSGGDDDGGHDDD